MRTRGGAPFSGLVRRAIGPCVPAPAPSHCDVGYMGPCGYRVGLEGALAPIRAIQRKVALRPFETIAMDRHLPFDDL